MRKIIKRFLIWCFREELNQYNSIMAQCEQERILLQEQINRTKNVLSNFDISIDVHHYAPSWAVISLQGKKTDYLKFIDLGDRDIREISQFLSQFDRMNHIKIDCSPLETAYFRQFKNRTFKV
ncbi:MAG: hypothetical protein RR212_12335 [Bacteroidales bacterium]